MSRTPAYTLHSCQHHFGWDNTTEPAISIAPGEVVTFETIDSSGGQLSPASGVADIASLDFSLINPVTGPVYVDGAEPGDALAISVEALAPSGWGWTANIPGFGLLADQFSDPALLLWQYDAATLAPAMYGTRGRVPLKPFVGTMGLAPAAPGLHSVVPPRRVGGNLDIRDVSQGAQLFLPVEVAGGLLSTGDTHAVQGDGEVCGTAIESPMTVTLKVDLLKGGATPFPRLRTAGPVSRHLDAKGYDVTTGIGTDLMEGARAAVAGMVELLTRREGIPADEAYMLCSVCGDLRISEIVDQPNWVVAFYFPRVVFE